MEYGDRIEKIGDNKVTGKTSDELEMMLKAIPAEVSSLAVLIFVHLETNFGAK